MIVTVFLGKWFQLISLESGIPDDVPSDPSEFNEVVQTFTRIHRQKCNIGRDGSAWLRCPRCGERFDVWHAGPRTQYNLFR